jgi:hypothetical protein
MTTNLQRFALVFVLIFLSSGASCIRDMVEQELFTTNKFVLLTMAIEQFKRDNGRPPRNLDELEPIAARVLRENEEQYLDQSWSSKRMALYEAASGGFDLFLKPMFFEYHLYPTGDYILFLRWSHLRDDDPFPEEGPPSLALARKLADACSPTADRRLKDLRLSCRSWVAFDGEIVRGGMIIGERQVRGGIIYKERPNQPWKGDVLPRLLQPYKWDGRHTYSF